MANVYIPAVGSVITLAEDWTFRVLNEKENAGLARLLKNPNAEDWYRPFGTEESEDAAGRWGNKRQPIDPGSHTISAGTSFEVTKFRVDNTKTNREGYSYVGFRMRVGGKFYGFIALLDDVNNIVF